MDTQPLWRSNFPESMQRVSGVTIENVVIMCDSAGRLYCGRCDATLVDKIEPGYLITFRVWLQHYLDEHTREAPV